MPKALTRGTGGRLREVDVADLYAATLTTAANGLGTLTFPPGRFTTPPVVTLTPLNPAGGQAIVAELVSVTATAVTVRTWRTQSATVLLLNTAVQPAAVTAGTVHVHAVAI